MNPELIKKQLENKEIFLLDVREIDEWDSGHILGATHLPLGDINEDSILDLPKDIPLLVYCRSGVRAGRAVEILRNLGFSNAVSIGGIMDWLDSGGEIVN